MSDIRYYEAVRVEVVRLLKEERKLRKLSCYAISKKTGVSESMLSLVEHGLRNPTMEIMLRIADGVGVDLGVLINKARSTVSKDNRKASKVQ